MNYFGICPDCGGALENYDAQEGGWCPKCEEWWTPDIIEDFIDENFDLDEDDEWGNDWEDEY